jgi:hypothetical protein
MHSNALHPLRPHSTPIASQAYWLAAALLFGAILLALALSGSDAGNALEFDDGGTWPTSAPSVPGANDFAPYNDGRPAPGEAVIGVNEASWQQGTAPANCPDGRCPTPAYYQPALESRTPPPPAIYPAGYAPASTYYASSDCECENCQCAGRGRGPVFPIARRAGGFVVRGAARIVTAPFRWRRNARANW